MKRARLTRAVVPVAVLATATALAANAGVAQARTGAAAGAPESVTVFLKAPHPAALRALALSHGLSRAQRLAALRTLVPSSAQHAAVRSVLGRNGFSVGRSTAWSVTATAPRSAVSALFGTRPSLAHASLAEAAGPLSRIPASLHSSVSAVFPTTAGPAVAHHMTTSTLAGPDFRRADTPAGVTPSFGHHDRSITVATLQLADFTGGTDDSPNDLVTYANEHGLPNPVADGQYKAVKVDGGPSATDDAGDGDIEVDLDQESILSTAPSANQHAYFAPNTNAGFDDVFASVFDDVTGDAHATAPDRHIVALSASWGECESGWGASAINTLEPIMESLVAAGVTIFASSGDDGIYDCRSPSGTGLDNSQADVDFPASSPVVVGVGGTNLSAPRSKANTGKNWTETSWTCTDAVSCQNTATGTGGTGGGASGSAYDSSTSDSFPGFPAPLYQHKYVKNAPFAGATNRLVPDIAADGDPATGFVLHTSDPEGLVLSGGTGELQVGGTSLSSPISAAQLANTLGDQDHRVGVGDIHTALYQAYQATKNLARTNPVRAFRDVVVGSNGAAADEGSDPSVDAQVGYDTNSGLGGVLWSALVPYLLPSTGT